MERYRNRLQKRSNEASPLRPSLDYSLIGLDHDPRDAILEHIRVSKIADYYDIQSLRRTANLYISSALQTKWFSAERFSAIIKAAYEVPDRELHEIIAQVLAEHIEEFIKLGDTALEEIVECFPVHVIKIITGRHHETKRELSRKDAELNICQSQYEQIKLANDDLQSELSFLDEESDHMIHKIGRLSRTLERYHETLNTTESCRARDCGARFDCFLAKPEQGSVEDYELRCSRCRCRLRQ